MLFPSHCRHVACKDVDFHLTRKGIEANLSGHSFYRGSDFLLLRHGEDWAVLALDKHSPRPGEELFHRLTGLRVLALPGTTRFVRDPGVDVLNPTALATRAQRELEEHPALTTVIIEGEFSHLSFIHEPELLAIEVHDLAPPRPPKLLHQARRVLDYHDVGAPVELRARLGDLVAMASRATTRAVVLPCYGGSEQRFPIGAAGEDTEGGPQDHPPPDKVIHYLDRLPPGLDELEATLIGCRRSQDIFKGHYGSEPTHFVNICPVDDKYLKKRESQTPTEGPLCLAKCCQLKEGFQARGNVAYVGWGATLQDVEGALCHLVRRAREAGVAPLNEAHGAELARPARTIRPS